MTAYPTWMADAVCTQTDPEVFFPDKGGSPWAAKRVCAACPVTTDCLTWALDSDVLGVWGATTEAERKRMRQGAAA